MFTSCWRGRQTSQLRPLRGLETDLKLHLCEGKEQRGQPVQTFPCCLQTYKVCQTCKGHVCLSFIFLKVALRDKCNGFGHLCHRVSMGMSQSDDL